jgi:hypothetical protein
MGAGVSTEEKEANAWKTSSFPSGFSSFSCGSWSGLGSGSRKRGEGKLQRTTTLFAAIVQGLHFLILCFFSYVQ